MHGILESDEDKEKLVGVSKVQEEMAKKQEDLEGEALEAVKQGNIDIVAAGDKK